MDMEADGAAGADGRSQGGAKRSRGGGVRGSEEAAAWGQPPALPPPQGLGAASRICRMAGSKGKDRHSKVYTAKGIRDRRVRLSVQTAIQFYDLQDRLGFDQPSKAVEWLINAAAGAIEKLPELDPASFAAFPVAAPGDAKVKQQKSGGSSTSETSKGSDLSLASRDREVTVASTSAQAASFTELLTGVAEHPEKGANNGLYTPIKFGNAPPFGMVPAQPFDFPASVEMHRFSLAPDALPAASAPAGEYNLNFSMSSGFLGAANRGTLQSNSQSSFSGHHQQQQQQQQFLFGHVAAPASENQLTASAALQLWDGFRHSGVKEKSDN